MPSFIDDRDDHFYHVIEDRYQERVAKTPDRVAYAIEKLRENAIQYSVKNASIGHIHAWDRNDKLYQFWAGTGKIFGETSRRGIEHFIQIILGGRITYELRQSRNNRDNSLIGGSSKSCCGSYGY